MLPIPQTTSVKKIVLLGGFLAAVASAGTVQIFALPGNTAFGTRNGFWIAAVDGTPGQLLASDDYTHTPSFSLESTPYAISTLAGDDPLQFARFLDPSNLEDSIARYEQAALLLDGLRQTVPGSLFDLTAGYQYALWSVFTPGIPLPDATAQTLLDEARFAAAIPSAGHIDLYSRLRILTPLRGDESNQEFLAFSTDPSWLDVSSPGPFAGIEPPSVQSVATPEPSAMTLATIGIGLILAGPLVRRRWRQVAASSKTRTMSR